MGRKMTDLNKAFDERLSEGLEGIQQRDLDHDQALASLSALIADLQAQVNALGGDVPPPVDPPVDPGPIDALTRGTFEPISTNLFDDGQKLGLQPARFDDMRWAPMVYQQHFGDLSGNVTAEGIRSAVANEQAMRDENGWAADWPGIIIDLENRHVFPFATGDTLRRNLRFFADACKKMADATGKPVGLYNIVPGGGIVAWTQVGDGASPAGKIRLQQIQEANDIAAEEVIPHVQFLAPQLYTYYSHANPAINASTFIPQWQRFARGTIAEARRIAPHLPILPVLWHEMHTGGMYKDLRDVPVDYWRAQWETVAAEGVPGAFWWGGYNLLKKTGEEALESLQAHEWAHEIVMSVAS